MRRILAAVALSSLAAGCNTMVAAPAPGTPEYAAFLTSRAYDCGLSVQRGRIIARHRGEERARYISAGQGYAVRAYKKPEGCGVFEREQVASELRALYR
ncbi:MAG: hypothetical protein ACRCWO_13420 [Bosea sp. (in: a-proteobacteria)]